MSGDRLSQLSPQPQAAAPEPSPWRPATPNPFPGTKLPPIPADSTEALLQRLRAFAERHGIRASQPELAREGSRFDPLLKVENYLKEKGMTVTRNVQVDDKRYDLLATKDVNGESFIIGVTIAFERTIALSNTALTISVRRQDIFQDCQWVQSNINDILKGMLTAAEYTKRS